MSNKKGEEHTLSQSSLRYWLGEGWEWGGVLLTFLTLEVSLRSVEQAKWITPQPSLTLILTLALFTTWLLAKSRLPTPVSSIIALFLGIIITAWQASSLLASKEAPSKGGEFLANLGNWWQLITTTSPNKGTIYFAAFLILFSWTIGYFSIWSTLKKQNAWVTVLLSGVTILVNLANLTEEYYIFFFFYLVFALLLIGSMNLTRSLKRFQKNKMTYPKWGMAYPVILLICVSLFTAFTAWNMPQIRAEGLETLVSKNMTWQRSLEEHWLNLFAEVPGKQPSLSGVRQRELHFDDSFHRGENVQFFITSQRSVYLRTQAYDTCTTWGWRCSATSPSAEEEQVSRCEDMPGRRELTYAVETRVKTDVLLIAGEFVSCNIPASAEVLSPLICNIDLVNPFYDSFLLGDVALFAKSFRKAREVDKILSLADVKNLLPQGLLLTGLGKGRYPPTEANYALMMDNDGLINIEVTTKRQGPSDAVAVLAQPPLDANQSYTVTSNITTATPSDLAAATGDYPSWVTDYYLKLPQGLPDRVLQLAKSITEVSVSAYDKVVKIKQYLSRIPYSEKVAIPPQGAYGVDYFLFILRSGNCGYFASAMAIFLRTSGVPARVCTGYLPGEWDEASGRFTVRAKHYHAWVEVYFPGYGWVEFEAAPSIAREVTGFVEELGMRPSEGREDSGLGREQGSISQEEAEKEGETEALTKNLSAADEHPAIAVEMELNLPLTIVILFTVLLMIALVSAFYSWLWHFTGPDYGYEVYAKMCRLASWVRLCPKPQQTPLEYGVMLTSAFPLQTESILSIIHTYQLSQYGHRKELEASETEHLERSWQKVYVALLKRLLHLR